MHAVERQDEHDDEVGDEERGVEGVPSVKVLEGLVGVVGLPVVAETLGCEEERELSERR
jgi:hypothetical protein